jgi:hypothetical protein
MTRSLLYYRGYIGESENEKVISLREKYRMLEDRPPGNEQRMSLLIDLATLSRWLSNRNKKKEEQPDDSSEHPCSDYCTTRISEIDKRIDAAIAGANGARDREGEETGGA